jgi:plastocyanin
MYLKFIVIGIAFLSLSASWPAKRDIPSSPDSTATGTLEGTVEFLNAGGLIRREHNIGYDDGGAMKMREAAAAGNEDENVVVYLTGGNLEGSFHPSSTYATMNQKDITFVPHVLPILKGTVVDFVNKDRVYHDVFSLSPVKRFDIGRRPTGEAVPVTFDKAGVVEIFCDIHSYMSAFIVVLSNPYFAKPDSAGFFKIANIPSGSYVVKVWHERLHATDQTVTITAGKTITIHAALQ